MAVRAVHQRFQPHLQRPEYPAVANLWKSHRISQQVAVPDRGPWWSDPYGRPDPAWIPGSAIDLHPALRVVRRGEGEVRKHRIAVHCGHYMRDLFPFYAWLYCAARYPDGPAVSGRRSTSVVQRPIQRRPAGRYCVLPALHNRASLLRADRTPWRQSPRGRANDVRGRTLGARGSGLWRHRSLLLLAGVLGWRHAIW